MYPAPSGPLRAVVATSSRPAALVPAACWFLAAAAGPAVAASKERVAAVAEGDGDVAAFRVGLVAATVACGVVAVVAAVLARRHLRRQGRAAGDWPARVCLLAAAALVFGGVAAAGVVSAVEASLLGLLGASTEGGPIELVQIVLWCVAGATALAAAWFARGREARGVLLLLGAGALLAAAREADLHELLTPGSQHHPGPLGAWGVRFRGDWWFSRTEPVGPRLVWGAIGVVVAVVGVYLFRRGVPGLLGRGKPMGRLIPPLVAVAVLLFAGFALDDLARYHWNMRQKQVCEEATELAAAVVYLGCVVWGARLGRRGA